MGSNKDDAHFGLDFQFGHSPVVSISIGRGIPVRYVPGVALRRRDLSCIRAQAKGRLNRAQMTASAKSWSSDLETSDWLSILSAVRRTPWLIYAAYWLVADYLADKDADDASGGGASADVDAGTAGITSAGERHLGPHRV